jgi:hypothetical protein
MRVWVNRRDPLAELMIWYEISSNIQCPSPTEAILGLTHCRCFYFHYCW